MSDLKEKKAKVSKTKYDTKKPGASKSLTEPTYGERDDSRMHLHRPQQDSSVDSRQRRSSPSRSRSPNVSSLANSPPPSLSSNESSVDPFEAAEHKRPVAIPPKANNKFHNEDKVEVVSVQDLSDREDDPSTRDAEAIVRGGLTMEERGLRGRERHGGVGPGEVKGFRDAGEEGEEGEEEETERKGRRRRMVR